MRARAPIVRAMRTRVVVQQRRSGRRGERVARTLWGAAEIAVTAGVVVLLLVAHQLWWTNEQARAGALQRVETLERNWEAAAPAPPAPEGDAEPDAAAAAPQPSGTPGPDPDRAYAVMRIPKLGVTVPVARGVSKAQVLNRGYVGHYPQTAKPGAPGNFAVAGHRNTHGEPFRRLDRLRTGDRIEVETSAARYVYEVAGTVPQTLPGDGTVLEPVPYSSVHPSARMNGPGNYLTLTTCTPEYTSTYRLVVWGRLLTAESR